MSDNEMFLAYERDGFIFWRSTTGETREIGATQKTFRALQDALESTLQERDQFFDMLIAAGLIEKPIDPQEIAKQALEEAKNAKEEATKTNQLLQELLKQLNNQQTTIVDTTAVVTQTDKKQTKESK